MLINKGFSANDIVSLKLVNGDELIARFEEESADTITIYKPLAVTLGPQGLGMIPWMFLGDRDKYVLQRSHVFAVVPSKPDAASQYIQGTTGIAIV